MNLSTTRYEDCEINSRCTLLTIWINLVNMLKEVQNLNGDRLQVIFEAT